MSYMVGLYEIYQPCIVEGNDWFKKSIKLYCACWFTFRKKRKKKKVWSMAYVMLEMVILVRFSRLAISRQQLLVLQCCSFVLRSVFSVCGL